MTTSETDAHPGSQTGASPQAGASPPGKRPRVSVVVPVRNAARFLDRTAPSALEAARVSGAELIYVDNGSTDGSIEYLGGLTAQGIQLYSLPRGSIAAVRNYGARRAGGEFIAFLDADCEIAPDYLTRAVEVLERTAAAATGCEVDIPAQPGWIEAAWHDMHFVEAEREVPYLNAANFFTRRDAFERVGGFGEELVTGEDAELCQRYVAHGLRIFASPEVRAVHLGNPTSVRQFYRRSVWHGLGMFGTINARRLDKPTAMMVLHLMLTGLGAALILGPGLPLIRGVALALLLQAVVPLVTVVYRLRQTGRRTNLARAAWLYWLYYWARIQAFVLVLSGRSTRYAK